MAVCPNYFLLIIRASSKVCYICILLFCKPYYYINDSTVFFIQIEDKAVLAPGFLPLCLIGIILPYANGR